MGEKGVSVVKVLITLTIFSLFGYTVTKLVIQRAHYQAIKDKVEEQARFAASKSNDNIVDEILKKGEEVNVILYEDDISIRRNPGKEIEIKVSYSDSIRILLFTYHSNFDINIKKPLPR